MIISCEKCSTTYVLDDALIPPQGAPVQCTQCQHVFTAKRPAPEAPPPPPARPGSSTMMFGAPAPGVTAAAQKNSTMMFGAPAAAAAPPAPSSARSTMVFGAPAVPPVAPKAPPTFGTPAANAASGGMPTPAASGKNQTMMFGAGAAAPAAPVPAAAKNTTMMFGGPAAPSAAPVPAPAAPAKNTTMMFGAPAVPPVGPVPSPAAPSKNQTMMFGTPASQAAAAPPPPAASPASNKATMVFGAVPPVASAPQKTNQTMMFGTPAGNAASAAAQASAPAAGPAAKTQLMGQPVEEPAEETVLDQPGQSARTVLFGTAQPGPAPAPAPAPAAPPPAKNQTMMFGRAPVIPKVTAGTVELAGIAADEDQPNESTVRVDQQALMGDGEAGESAPATEAPPSEVEARHDRTQRFAMSDTGGPTPPGGQSAVDARHNRTQLFAMSTVQDVTDAGTPALSAFSSEPMSAGTPMAGDTTLPPTSPDRLEREVTDFSTTLPPDGPSLKFAPRARPDPAGVSVLQEAGEPGVEQAEPQAPAPVATTLPSLAPLDSQRMAPLELPPEPQGSPRDLLAAQQRQLAGAPQESETVQLPRGSTGGAGKVIVIILALIALALAGVLAWRLFGRQLLEKQGSTEARKTAEDALAGLRRDDVEAQEQAIARLAPLLAANPELPEVRAAMVLVAALQLDDAKALAQPDEARARKLRGEAEGESEEAQTAKAQLATVELALSKHRATIDARRAALLDHVARLRALPPVEQGAAEVAVLRAEAVARAVLGEHEALAIAVHVRQLMPQAPDDWAELAGPEFALNGGSSREEALKELEVVRQRATNSTFFRPYVLTARLHMQAGDDTLAAQDLTTVVSLNSKHVVAQRLLASLTVRD